jgi:hypothetical protein
MNAGTLNKVDERAGVFRNLADTFNDTETGITLTPEYAVCFSR